MLTYADVCGRMLTQVYDDGVVVTSERRSGSTAAARGAGGLAAFEDNPPAAGTVKVTGMLRMLVYADVC
jgi:hypothetical protein